MIYALLSFVVIGSIIAVETKDLLSSVVSVGAVGFALSIAFLMMGAPDIALVQVIVEIISIVMLIRLVVMREDTTLPKRIETFAVASILILFGFFMGVAYYAFKDMPNFGHPLMTVSKTYMEKGLESTGAPNLVTSVLLDFRAYDTLGEATVLFVSIVGALTVLRRRGRKRRE